MGIAMNTDDENRTTVVVNDIVACGAAFAGGMSWLHLTDSQDNRTNVHLPRAIVEAMHRAYIAADVVDASDQARRVS
jgi:hypothetical protein